METSGYFVVPEPLLRHLASIRTGVAELNKVAQTLPGVFPSGDSDFAGTKGGADAFRRCLDEIAALIRKTGKSVDRYTYIATACVGSYISLDEATADEIRKCLTDGAKQ